VVGYDDILLASLLTPPLTSVRVPKYRLGAAAAQLLFERMGGHSAQNEIVLSPELVVRQSSPPELARHPSARPRRSQG
jgi:LacI family transcriptional regulator